VSYYQAQASKFFKSAVFDTTGIIDPIKGHTLFGEQSMRVAVENVGAANVVKIQGKTKGITSFVDLATFTGAGEVLVDVSTYDIIRFEVDTYDGTAVEARLTASGFFSMYPVNAINTTTSVVTSREESRVNVYGEISSLVTAAVGTILSYTPPVSNTFILDYMDVGGTNQAAYTIYIGGVKQAKKRTSPIALGDSIQFEALEIAGGTLIKVEVTHDRPDPGDFETRIVGVLR
jgi:hypothetical protein